MGAIKEMVFALSLCSFWHQSAFRNNEINANICWKDAHFEDHLLPNYLGHLHGSQGRFQRVSHPCCSDKRKNQVLSLVVCLCGLTFDEASVSHTHDSHVTLIFLSFNWSDASWNKGGKCINIQKRKNYLQPEKWHTSVSSHVHKANVFLCM